jgi:hypothetical protein
VTIYLHGSRHAAGYVWCIAKSKSDIEYASDVYATEGAAMVALADALGL